ncbi:Uncharacterized protein OBRU01_05670 [Operophtera brumata]|uniref:Uncharacterized protein n=1 Tax=Operophtera brumata TaxID=104452 RepID=A0A0L7LNE3_OPEBR|nr:Uncharacterized protein OBRU01_05670 [Operophtera brumata]
MERRKEVWGPDRPLFQHTATPDLDTNRVPVFLPAMCPTNELYYPGDQKDDWICDCRPDIPICEKNPCATDGTVSWNGKCETLGSTGPCNFTYSGPAVLEVNATSLVVSCVRLRVPGRTSVPSSPSVPDVQCPPGCKRSISGKCVPST